MSAEMIGVCTQKTNRERERDERDSRLRALRARERERQASRGRYRCSAKREQFNECSGLAPESHGQNLALTVIYVPYSPDSEL